MMTDPYRTLGVERTADTDTIRKKYRALAKQYHPDLNKDPKATDRFKEINAAHEILGDEEKRKLWDEFGEASTRPGFDAAQARAWKRAGGMPGGMPGGGFGGGVDVDDLLSSLFGGGGSGRAGGAGFQQRRGQDQQVEIAVDFLTSVLGGEHRFTIRRPDGSTEPVTVPIPAGAKSGGRVRLKGQGLPPRGGGPCGDLLVNLKVADHPALRRLEDDLELDVPITVLEAMKGATITVPTPTGDVKVQVPAGSRSGTRLRIKGRGVQKKATPGDLYLVLRPTVPTTQDPEVLAAAQRLEQAYGDVRSGLKL
jgi:curved DNA-binding protein